MEIEKDGCSFASMAYLASREEGLPPWGASARNGLYKAIVLCRVSWSLIPFSLVPFWAVQRNPE